MRVISQRIIVSITHKITVVPMTPAIPPVISFRYKGITTGDFAFGEVCEVLNGSTGTGEATYLLPITRGSASNGTGFMELFLSLFLFFSFSQKRKQKKRISFVSFPFIWGRSFFLAVPL